MDKLYRFSPIGNEKQLIDALEHVHESCHKLCKKSLGKYLPVSGTIGIFCHYDDEYDFLLKLRNKLTDSNISVYSKYFKLHKPITIKTKDTSEATYRYLYIRKPDPYRSQVGDMDFYLPENEYSEIKQAILNGKQIKGLRTFERADPDMMELFDPDIDTLGYLTTNQFQ